MNNANHSATTKAKNKYNAKTYDRVALQVPKGVREVLHMHAQYMGESLNGFLNRAIDETMERDGMKDRTEQ